MIKSRLVAMFMASLVLVTSCSEQEEPQPVEDTARIDALRQEIRELMVLIHGEETTKGLLELESEELSSEVNVLEAEVEKLQAQYSSAVSYQVVAVDFQGNVIPGASVTLNQAGQITTIVAGDDGAATFTGVKSGYLVGVVRADGYATANFTTSLFNSEEGRPNTRVPLLPKSAEALEKNGAVTFKGFLYANLNVANDTAGTEHRIYDPWWGWSDEAAIDSKAGTDAATENAGPNSWAPHRTYDKVQSKLTASPYVTITQIPGANYYDEYIAGTVQFLIYEGATYEATFSNDNQYSLSIPIRGLDADGVELDFRLHAEEFTASVTYVAVGSTFTDGAPVTVDNPTPVTSTQTRIFRFAKTYWGEDFWLENDYSIPTVEENNHYYFNEGSVD